MNELNLNSNAARCVETSINEGVLTIKMNQPKTLNGWTQPMMEAFKQALLKAAENAQTKAVIFTGAGDYYTAGVNFGGGLQAMSPKNLRKFIISNNQSLFEAFLNFPKPILIAINGPAIGAGVTSATLCNGIIASEKATFNTPFAALGVPKEGCSSYLFPRLIGDKNATRILEDEGWKPTAAEAKDIGLVQWVVPHDKLQEEAHKIAKRWIDNDVGRTYLADSKLEDLDAANRRESIEIADSILSYKFMSTQAKFLWSKKKTGPSIMFWAIALLRPIWARFL